MVQRRYDVTAKRRTVRKKYEKTDKGRIVRLRYMRKPSNRAKQSLKNSIKNPRRIRLAGAYRGMAPSADQAVALKAKYLEARREFIAGQQARKKAEGV